MIGTVQVRVSAGHPNMPLAPVFVFTGSAATIGVLDVPKTRCGTAVTGVNVTITNADSEQTAVAATLVSGVWCATFAASVFGTSGFCSGGLKVEATGTDENGTARTWDIGQGDLSIMETDASVTPGVARSIMHFYATQPTSPITGDCYADAGSFYYYNGSAWKVISGSGAVTWDSITGKPSTFAPSAHTHTQSEIADFGGPYLKTSESDSTITHGSGPSGSAIEVSRIYSQENVEVDGKVVTANPNDTGPLANIIQYGGKTARAEMTDYVDPLAKYPMQTITSGAMLDRTVNWANEGGEFTFPAATSGVARDFVLAVAESSTAPSVSFPDVNEYYSDDDEVWTAEANAINIWYFSELLNGVFQVAHKALTAKTQSQS